MKVAFKNMINGYYGKADDSVIYYIRKTNSFYIKKRPVVEHGPNQERMKDIMRNLQKIKPAVNYKLDFGFYVDKYNQLPANKYGAVMTWNNLWVKAMFAMQAALPGIDLCTLTRAQIYDQSLPCLSLKAAVEAGLLPMVKGYERFDNPI